MVAQTNDTELHKPMRKEFSALQEALVLEKTLASGGGLKECTHEENVMILASVFSDERLHLQACKGYKTTGTTVAFDGSEDELIGNDARKFWDELDMRAKINRELSDLKKRYDAGNLKWNYENVQKEVIPYPKHGKYDHEPEGMEDEAVESAVAEEEKPWEEEESDADVAASEAEDAEDGETEPFDPSDWVDPEEAREKYASSAKDIRCHGDTAPRTNCELALPNAQSTVLLDYRDRMRAYKECYDSLTSLRHPISHSLCMSVGNVMKVERKRLHSISQRRGEVFARMDEMLQEDICKRRKLQEEYNRAIRQTKEKHALEKKVSACKSNFSKLSAELKRVEAVVTAMTSQKAYSPEMLGQGRGNGGLKEHKQNRYDVLERLRRVGGLTEAQKGQWDFFKGEWDAAQASEYGAEWGLKFAQNMQGVLEDMLHGESHAFSEFVKKETDRVLGVKGALVAPGFPTSEDAEMGPA